MRPSKAGGGASPGLGCRLFIVVLSGSQRRVLGARRPDADPIKFPDTQYEPVDWAELDGWAERRPCRGLRDVSRRVAARSRQAAARAGAA